MKYQPTQRDRLVTATTADKYFKISLARITQTAQVAASKHQLNPLMATILADLMLSASLATNSLSGDDTISIKIVSGGCLTSATAESNARGEIRGFVANPKATTTGASKQELIENAIKEGTLQITKWIGPDKIRQHSIIALEYKNIAKDMALYYSQSEQVQSAIVLNTKLNEKNFTIENSVGLLVQALPDTPEEALAQMEDDIDKLNKLTSIVATDADLKHVIFRLFPEREIKVHSSDLLDFYCRCSKDSFAKGLLLLKKEDLTSLANDAQQEIVCQYCAEKYYFSKEEIRVMLVASSPPSRD